MIYVFTFLGEFGYELFNWQGVVRKFAKTIGRNDRIVCCGRPNMEPLYETADMYIDISDVELYQKSQASAYFAVVAGSKTQTGKVTLRLDKDLRRVLTKHISELIPRRRGVLGWLGKDRLTHVFSSRRKVLNGCVFGANAHYWRRGDIYDQLDVGNNEYRKFEPDLRLQSEITSRVGFDLSEPYVLVQGRSRDVGPTSEHVIPKQDLIGELAQRSKVILLSFSTGRANDSYSRFDSMPNCSTFTCTSLVEQTCLIHFAKACVFFTEGDFGSHMYVPPFMGKDVVAIAPRSVYALGTTPIDFWNRNVFQFGGQILAEVSEDLFANPANIVALANAVHGGERRSASVR